MGFFFPPTSINLSPLGSTIIPRKMHFENHSPQFIRITQPALLRTILPELMLPHHVKLCMLLLENRMMTRVEERSFGRASRLLSTCWPTEKIRETVSKFITVFLIKWKHMPKQILSACLCLILYLEVAPGQAHFPLVSYGTINHCRGPLTTVALYLSCWVSFTLSCVSFQKCQQDNRQ